MPGTVLPAGDTLFPAPPRLPFPHSLEAIHPVNSAFWTTLLSTPFLLSQPRLLPWFIPNTSCPGSCHKHHPGPPATSLFPINLFLEGSKLGHAPSLLETLSWILNVLRTKSKLPKWPRKSSTIDSYRTLNYISHTTSPAVHIPTTGCFSSLRVRKPPHHGYRKHPVSRSQLRQLLLLPECFPTHASPAFPSTFHSARLPEHPQVRQTAPSPVSPTDRGFLRAEPDTASSDGPRDTAASGLSAYLLLCDHRCLYCGLGDEHSGPAAARLRELNPAHSLADVTQSRPSPPPQPASSIRAPAPL